ncbi:hypothetical protein MNV49_001992 [Pseudohyphozyma bogoriensis]|nr:hypothetical protein MNV49_001992 [Pseudohyphozyma bogoriensis]
MSFETPYDPPIASRRRAGSLSASAAPPAQSGGMDVHSDTDSDSDGHANLVDVSVPSAPAPPPFAPASSVPLPPSRRGSLASLSGAPDFSGQNVQSDTDSSTSGTDSEEDDKRKLVDAPSKPSTPAPPYDGSSDDSIGGVDYKENPYQADTSDWRADVKTQRPGRMSKGWEAPGTTHSQDAEVVLGQIYDLTHAIDALDNDIDKIHALRKKISKIDPWEDVGGISTRADLDSLSALTTQTGRSIASLENWLTALHKQTKGMRAAVKAKQSTIKPQEIGELKFQISSAKLDFADALERIREGAWQEQEHRQRVRLWMARHIRAREVDIEDDEVKSLLKASELGAADGVANNDVTSYAGLWALNNPYTELEVITSSSRWLHDDLDQEIMDKIIPQNGKKKSSRSKVKSSKSAPPPPVKAKFYGSRASLYSSNMTADARIRYLNSEVDGAERDLVYGFPRQKQLERSSQRKKLIIALLVVIIIGLILLVWFATMSVPQSSRLNNGGSSADSTSTGRH